MSLHEFWLKATDFTQRNSPTILAGLGVAGLVSTGYMSYKAGSKAHDIMVKYHEDKGLIKPDDKDAKKAILKETVKDLTPILLPPIIMGAFSATCIIFSNRISTKRVAVLSAAYSIADSRLKDYQQKMLENLGEARAQKVREAIAKDDLSKDPVPNPTQIVVGDGTVLCKDYYTKRYFQSTPEKIGAAINSLTADVLCEMYVSLNDFFEKIGLEQIPMGDDLGWNADDALGGKLPIYYTACLTSDNRPCLVIEYDICAREDFRNLH